MWCFVYFFKMKLNVMYLGSLLEFFFEGDNNLVILRKNRCLWEIGINMFRKEFINIFKESLNLYEWKLFKVLSIFY